MTLGESRIRTLILALRYAHKASYYDDWVDGFAHHPAFDCRVVNILSLKPAVLADGLDEHDAVVLMHSVTADTVGYLAPLAPVLADRAKARLFAFVGNEYNSAVAPLSDKIATLTAIRPDIVATQLLAEAGEYLYAASGARVMSVPHGLNPKVFRPGPDPRQRRVDIGARSFRYPVSLGDNDRNRLIDYFRARGTDLGLTLDISQDARFGRDDWAGFLANCRGTISTEAGSWYLDRDDGLARSVHDHLAGLRKGVTLSATSPLRRIARRLPIGLKETLAGVLKRGPIGYEAFEPDNVDFDDIHEKFFTEAARSPVYSKAISSRHFDAIGTKTCQIMFPGRFNDILEPNVHYLPLDPTFDDVNEVVRRFKDDAERAAIVDRAYEHVIAGHTLDHRLTAIADALRS